MKDDRFTVTISYSQIETADHRVKMLSEMLPVRKLEEGSHGHRRFLIDLVEGKIEEISYGHWDLEELNFFQAMTILKKKNILASKRLGI